MKCLCFYIVLCLCVTQVLAQSSPTAFKWQEKVGDNAVGFNFSTSRYNGDLSERYNISHLQLGWGAEALYRHRLHERLSIVGCVGLYHVWADQAFTTKAANHLSFSSTNFSSSLYARWDMLSVDGIQRNIMYLIGGAGITKLSPATMLAGKFYYLPNFKTEGVTYSQWVGQLLYGVGFPLALSSSTQLSFEGRYTHVLSDYMDDVSTVYVDKSMASDIEQNLSDRRLAEQLPANVVGAARGNPKKNDGYFLFTLQLIHKF